MLVHAGHSVHSGHYYCFVRAPNGFWHQMDDTQVSQVACPARACWNVRDRRDLPAGVACTDAALWQRAIRDAPRHRCVRQVCMLRVARILASSLGLN